MSCSWVKDNVDDCPYGFWLKLHYTYNILDVEAAPEYVTDAYVYVYDAQGNYVKRIYANQGELKANDYRVRVEGLPEGDYQFVVWSGIGNSQYAVSGDTQTIDDFRLTLAGATTSYSAQLLPLFHGMLSTVHYDDDYALHHVQLMKNTNQLSCIVVPLSQDVKVTPDDYTMRVVAANSVMDAYNRIVPGTSIDYEPFVSDSITVDDTDYGQLHGAKFSMNTMRLMSNSDTRIILERKSTGQTIFNVSFPEYIGMIGALYTNLGREVPVQEYLDRQDFYTIVFYLSGDLERLMQLQVNSWRLRAFNYLKL